MKEAKKIGNMVIRENSRHSSRAETKKLKPIQLPAQESKRVTKQKIDIPNELAKQFVEA